jgi:hypothetical protein
MSFYALFVRPIPYADASRFGGTNHRPSRPESMRQLTVAGCALTSMPVDFDEPLPENVLLKPLPPVK